MYKHEVVVAKRRKRWPILLVLVLLLAGSGAAAYLYLAASPTIDERIEQHVTFEGIPAQEQEAVKQYIRDNEIKLESSLSVTSMVNEVLRSDQKLLDTYVPVTSFNSAHQQIAETSAMAISSAIDTELRAKLIESLAWQDLDVQTVDDPMTLDEDTYAYIPLEQLSHQLKLLAVGDAYFLDDFAQGARFAQASFSGDQSSLFNDLSFSQPVGEDEVFSVNMTGVTALTRVMMRKLAQVGDPLYFSANIGEFLAAADLTHVSNEVSFVEGCGYHNALFCSPPEFIETLKASGVDLVELTGNHNNDRGSEANASSINLYRELGWGTVGGGLNAEDAAKPYLANQKGSQVAFLAYNYPDSPNGGAIAGANSAGANSFDFNRIEQEIMTAKESSDFVIVNVQYWECYAYPDGYVEFPECDKPIGEQEANFKQLIDLGADMVVGSSAHQPQTYELYKGKPIYYGLGNLYFDQNSWPGTERGIVLTHYFIGGELLQTKLTPTVYDRDLQTRVMDDQEAAYLLGRLRDAR